MNFASLATDPSAHSTDYSTAGFVWLALAMVLAGMALWATYFVRGQLLKRAVRVRVRKQ